MFRRIWGYMLALVGIKLDQWEDPDVLLKQAQDEMAQAHARNKEQAVKALTERNNLQAEVDRTVKEVANLQAKAELAVKNGDNELALQILREKQAREQNLTSLQSSLENAIKMTEQIKVALQREEERIRTKTAEAMSLKTQYKQAQIENSINTAMDKWSSAGNDQAFERAAAKIASKQSESAARTELAAGRLDSRIDSLNDAAADSAATAELAKLQEQLGLNQPTTTASTATTAAAAGASDVEKELADLEAKVSAGGASPGGTPPA